MARRQQIAQKVIERGKYTLLELPDIRDGVEPFDPGSLTWPWRHHDARVDTLQQQVIRLVSQHTHSSRSEAFAAIAGHAAAAAGRSRAAGARPRPAVAPVPHLSEPWYCCSEPDAQMGI